LTKNDCLVKCFQNRYKMITITDKAKNKLDELRKEEGKNENWFIRVGVEGGGCSGLSYKMEFTDQMKEGDQVFEEEKLKVVVDMKSYLYLHGTELHYSDGLNGKGFHFINPNATRTCGCGESFAV
jgi:iron-sulfur cluster assembly protein